MMDEGRKWGISSGEEREGKVGDRYLKVDIMQRSCKVEKKKQR